ncbi:amino acid adenylation domain-containing protein [Streptomyces sp. NPDC046870]|uniref:amino acid adenylation domain-containing protein n=1 Tax=Streptomyces sp. NPDC046870 TaxID=3155135 RepID=UPI0034546067
MLTHPAGATTSGRPDDVVSAPPPREPHHRCPFGETAEHSLALRLTGGPAVRAAREAFARAGHGLADPERVTLWSEDLPFASEDPRALRLRERERLRGLGEDRPGVRAVLFGYRDDAADLVVVGRHDVLGRTGLRRLAHTLAGRAPGGPDVLPEPPARAAAVRSRPVAPDTERPVWGLAGAPAGEEDAAPAGPDAVPVAADPVAADPFEVIAAVALVLSRYEQTGTVRLVLPASPVEDDGAGGGVLTVRVDETHTATEFVERVRRAARDLTWPADAALPAVGVLFTGDHPDELYRPFLAPVLPLLLSWRPADGLWAPAGVLPDPGVVDPAQASRFLRCVRHVLGRLREDANPVLGRIETTDPAHTAVLRALGRSGPPLRDSARTLHDAVRAVALAQPDRTAVSAEDGTLTYAELDARATAWAHALRERGAGRGGFVGVCLDRTADLVVALLAVLKTGAAYVPLDPHYPADRLRLTAEDAGLSLVLTTLADFPAGSGVEVIDPARLTAPAPGALPDTSPDDAAYVIYTSGTTGRPKGVVVPHRNVTALLAATRDDMEFGPEDVWTLFHSSAFDFSVWEIWGCLLTGGRLVVVPFMTTRSPADFHRLLVHEGVTVLSQTPSAFGGLLDADAAAGPDRELALRLVVFGGEALDPRMLRPWFRRHPPEACRMVNMYGITETTVHVTARDVTPVDADTGSACVGRALPGWSVSVRDARGRPLPVGAAGEIYVGGAGVARHYLGREELTAERFPTDPVTGERLYRSGDRGRMRPDGSLDHLGRLDDQVKLRGFRIELGEVRSVLLADPAVAEAAVVLDERSDAAYTRLVGYVVLRHGSALDVRRRVAGVLPEHMVPAVLVPLPRLPLTVNGKLDRARLPLPDRAGDGAEPDGGTTATADGTTAHGTGPGSAPSATATTVLAAWRAALADDSVTADEDFFESGGNSLVAVRLLTALRDLGFAGLSPRDLYVHRTATRLSALIDSRAGRS